MKKRYAHFLLAAFGLFTAQYALAQPPCSTTFAIPAGQTAVGAASWAPATVPPNMTGNVNTTTTLGSTTATVASAVGLAVGNGVTGPNIPPGTTITAIAGTTITLSNPATGTGTNVSHTYTVAPWPNNYPPTNQGTPAPSSCSICPATYSVSICAGQYVNMYLCAGNLYTFSMCSSAAAWNSTITVTSTGGVPQSYAPNWDDDGCGPVNGHAVVTFTPQTSNIFRIRVFDDPCLVNGALCGTLQVACNPFPPPPPNDNPAGAITLSPGGITATSCTPTFTTAAFGTPTTGVPLPFNCGAGCTAGSGSYATSDVWYTAVVPASGNLSVQLEHISATNMAMAVYTAPGPGGPFSQAPGCSCNADSSPGILNPFVTLSGLSAGTTVYIRVWPEAGLAANGSFTICAYEPVPPANDNPCGAAVLPVTVACTPQTFTTQNATPIAGITVTPATPTCGTPVTGGDVWFAVTIPATGSLTVNTAAGSLTDMAMAAYSLTAGSICGPGTLTEVACNDNNGASTMPRLVLTGAVGQVYYVRMWNKTSLFGTFQICAFQNNPPSNDNPCGAAPLPVQPGCLFGAIQTNENATTTPTALAGQHTSITAPSCGAPVSNDVWYTAVVPSNGVIQIDTDDGQLTDAAYAVYTATGNCGAGTLALTQVGGACSVGGSANGVTMPSGQVTGLAPGSTVYIRVWRQGGIDGTFQICARTTVPPAGNCFYTLRMTDTAADGWNGSFVTICVGGVCTNYSINGALSNIQFGANFGQIVTVSYTAAGGFQNQIGYQVLSSSGGLIYGSTSPPTAGPNTAFVVDALCNVPPAPPSDCVGALPVCDTQVINQNPTNTGGVVDLNASNRGCLSSNERQGVWFRFQAQTSGQLAFNIAPPTPTDYDWAVWGPFTGGVTCPPPSPPIRCSYSAIQGATGLNYSSVDLTEGAGGDGFTRYIDVTAGQWYLLYVDNFSMNGVNFTLNWNNTPTNILDCTIVLPVELLSLSARANGEQVDVNWVTASEKDASHFLVERSGDGAQFEPIGQVAAAGTTQMTTNYAFVDSDPLNGTNYYRLRTVDTDGTAGLSPVVTAEFRRGNIPLRLFPNPAGETVRASFDLIAEGQVSWRILDMSGRLVLQSSMSATAGMNQVDVPLTRVEAGSYLFEVVDASGVVIGNTRFMRQ